MYVVYLLICETFFTIVNIHFRNNKSVSCCRGYRTHTEPETDSDGDGGWGAKLRGRGHIEFSKKGIPHGILHFPRQLQLAGHIYMHDVSAAEGAHRLYVKKVMSRVRKGTDYDTSTSSIDWVFRVRTWAKIIDHVHGPSPPKRRRKDVQGLKVFVTACDVHM